MAAALPIIAGAGAAFQVVGAIQQANAASRANEYNAQLAARNAELVRTQTAEEERILRIQNKKFLSSNVASYAASGIEMSGTPEDVLGEMAASMELDALKLRHSGELKAAGLTADAAMSRQKASSARTGGYLSAGGYLLGGAANVGEKVDEYW